MAKKALCYAVVLQYAHEFFIMEVTSENRRRVYGRKTGAFDSPTNVAHFSVCCRRDTLDEAKAELARFNAISAHHRPIIKAAREADRVANRDYHDAVEAAKERRPDAN